MFLQHRGLNVRGPPLPLPTVPVVTQSFFLVNTKTFRASRIAQHIAIAIFLHSPSTAGEFFPPRYGVVSPGARTLAPAKAPRFQRDSLFGRRANAQRQRPATVGSHRVTPGHIGSRQVTSGGYDQQRVATDLAGKVML